MSLVSKEIKKESSEGPNIGLYVAMGLCFGTTAGVLLNQIAFGPALGLLGGVVAYQIALMRDSKAKQ